MWGVDTISPWQPFAIGRSLELDVAEVLGSHRPICLLPGGSTAGSRGRFGIIALPAASLRLEPGPGRIAAAIDSRPSGALRVLLLGYELGAPEVFLAPQRPPRGQPAGLAIDLAAALIVDYRRHLYKVIGPDPAAAASLAAAARTCDFHRRGTEPRRSDLSSSDLLPSSRAARLVPTVSDAEHCRRIRRTLEHIAAGDIYQANIARRLHLDGTLMPLAALRALGRDNPVAHAAYVRIDGVELLSNSMETLLTFDPGRRVAESFPIKGTRGRANAEDPIAPLLASDPKEFAEHVMIVDLVRNDLGRVCEPGSIEVPMLMGTYGFRGVWHGVSLVRGRLRDDRSIGDLVAALFPGGSITGAPKRRAMQIIAALEGESRGFYTGSIGIIGPSGRVSMSILIRTLVRDSAGWSVSVGGGIVADSDPMREVRETWEKVEVFRRLLGDRRPHAGGRRRRSVASSPSAGR